MRTGLLVIVGLVGCYTAAPLSDDSTSDRCGDGIVGDTEGCDDANLTAVLVDYGPDSAPEMVTRGWLDPQNRVRLDRGRTLRRGQLYDLSWDLQPDDHVFPAGHRIGLVVVSTDHDYTIRPLPGTRLTLDPSASTLRLPLVGGTIAVR